MAFDAFSPDYFTPGGFVPGLVPGQTPLSPSASYDASVNQAQITSSSLQVPQTPVFVAPPQLPTIVMTPAEAQANYMEVLFSNGSQGVTPLNGNIVIAPPTATVDQVSQTITMPAPAPPNPVTFPPSPPQGPPVSSAVDPVASYWDSLFGIN
jgi:hypothetical protein